MSNLRGLLNLAASSDILNFRDQFAQHMNNRMAQGIIFKDNTPVQEPSPSVNEGKMTDKEKSIAKKAFEDGQDNAKEEEEKKIENSDSFLFSNSEGSTDKAKEVVKNYNDSHPNSKLETRSFNYNGQIRFFVIGDKISRKTVRSLVKTAGGKYQE